ncbi:DUF4879 domain-containing protein [Sphingomonas sp. DT-51]|uniref:DUF4879 domain-containing protein n=1 Tax=Sphingomonas sp. DT-51 TaxID=3396165 RepID=UPI003F19531F
MSSLSLALIASPLYASPAPPVTSVRVINVQSENGGSESESSNASSTANDHGRSFIEVTVLEIGQATWRNATFSQGLPSSANARDQLVCGSSDQPTTCLVGEDSIGSKQLWRFDPAVITGSANPSGSFRYEAGGNGGSASTQYYIK